MGGRQETESGGSAGFVPLSSRRSCASGAVVVHVGDTGKTFIPSEVQGVACWYIWGGSLNVEYLQGSILVRHLLFLAITVSGYQLLDFLLFLH